MRAVVLNSFDGIDGLELSEVDDPRWRRRGAGDRPRGRAWSVGSGEHPGSIRDVGRAADFPQIQGWDFAGETDQGERVFGFVAPPFMGIGSFAEKLSVPPAVLAGLPEEISFEEVRPSPPPC